MMKTSYNINNKYGNIMSYLKFISDKDLCVAVAHVVNIIETAEHDAEIKLHKNVVDPFSALFHGITCKK